MVNGGNAQGFERLPKSRRVLRRAETRLIHKWFLYYLPGLRFLAGLGGDQGFDRLPQKPPSPAKGRDSANS